MGRAINGTTEGNIVKRAMRLWVSMLVALAFFVSSASSSVVKGAERTGETQRASALQSLNRDASIEIQAKTVQGELLLRMLQFDAPYPGYFQELQLYRNGQAVTFRNAPRAYQNSSSTTLRESAFAEVRRNLAAVDLNRYSTSFELRPSGLHTVLILFDGHAYQRRHFIGPLPASIQTPIKQIQDALRASPVSFEEIKKSNDAAREAERVLRAGSGWNVSKEPRLTPLKGGRCFLLTVSGVRRTAATAVYHALIFYPEGRLASPQLHPGNWDNNPRTYVQMLFEYPNAPSGIGITTVTHELHIEYRLMENTLNVESQSFPLANGNLFVIELDRNWAPVVRSVLTKIEGPSTAPAVLAAFKAQLRTDSAIQALRLGE